MREIKFRAWDKITKQYYVVKGLEYDDDGNLDEVYLAAVKISESNPVFNLRKPNDVVLEQYTGLKDNNGKEIYEGDIVRYVSEGESIDLAVIKRKDEDKEQSYWLTGFVYEPFATVDEEELTEDEYESLGGMEIIGNIHENPELIEKEEE